MVAVDLRGYGDSDKPPRGYDGWTLAGDMAGLIRAMGYGKATLVGHADGGLVCWATAILHPRLVRSIALVSSPHPVHSRGAVCATGTQRRALLPTFLCLSGAVPPRTAADCATTGREMERLVRSRSGRSWPEQRRSSPTSSSRLRSAIRIPGRRAFARWNTSGGRSGVSGGPRVDVSCKADGRDASHSDPADSRRTRPVHTGATVRRDQASRARTRRCTRSSTERVITRIRRSPTSRRVNYSASCGDSDSDGQPHGPGAGVQRCRRRLPPVSTPTRPVAS